MTAFDLIEDLISAFWQPFIDAYWAAEYQRVHKILEAQK